MPDTNEQMSQTAVVVYGIKKMLLDGVIKPGDKLPIEKDLAPLLGVSRSSLREGVSALAIMGILEPRQGAGTYVTSLDVSLLLLPMSFMIDLQRSTGAADVHIVRRVLETEAAGRAARHFTPELVQDAARILDQSQVAIEAGGGDHEAVIDADMRFHRLIAETAGNGILAALIEALASRTLRARMWRAITDAQADAQALTQHRSILHALAEGDSDRARVLMAHHLMDVEDFVETAPDAVPLFDDEAVALP